MPEVIKISRIYKNCREAINEIERDIVEMGITVHPHTMQNKDVKDDDNYSTLEVQNYSFTILDTSDKDKITNNLEWCKAEFLERITNVPNPGKAWLLRKDVWEEFLVKGKFEYTYGDRINRFEQVDQVIEELRENPDSRQCIIHVHFPEDINRRHKRRMPCSVYYQLMIRRNALDIIYNMRSSDFATHFKNDIWQAVNLRNYIANRIKRPYGLFHMNVGSLHIYKGYGKHKIVF